MKTINWNNKAEYALGLTQFSLLYAIADCIDAAKAGTDEGFYHDEASVYRTELKKRGLKNYEGALIIIQTEYFTN